MAYYNTYIQGIHEALAGLVVTDESGRTLDPEAGLQDWVDRTAALRNRKGRLFFCGNGASAMMASHMAADAGKNGELRTMAFNDAAWLTALANDIAYDQVFAVPLRRYAEPNDLLVTISSSGNSKNIVAALEAGRELGLQLVTLSGMKPDNRSRGLGHLNFYVPAKTYGFVECSHQVILHAWLDRSMELAGLTFG